MGQEEDTEGPKPAGPGAEPGAWLAAAREQAGLSLVQAADRLHLDVSAVKAMEAGRFEVLGAAVYARGHLRRYAELLGLPAGEVEKSFLQLHAARSTPDLRYGALLDRSNTGRRALRPQTAALGALVLVVIGVVLWARRVPRTHAVPSRPVASAAAVGAPTVGTRPADSASTPGAPAPSVPVGGALDSPMGPSSAVPAGTADASARFNGQSATLWDPSLDSAAQRAPVDGGGGIADGPSSQAASGHSAAKAPAPRAHGTRP